MNDRRTFLRGLATLPLIGGSVALIGAPSAVAEPITVNLVENYKTWLDLEMRFLTYEMASDPAHVARYQVEDLSSVDRRRRMESIIHMANGATRFHGPRCAGATTRAALVLSAVGCDWREGFADGDA